MIPCLNPISAAATEMLNLPGIAAIRKYSVLSVTPAQTLPI